MTDGCDWNTLGLAYYQNEQWREAIDALRRALELAAGCSGGARFYIAIAHARPGERTEAEQWYGQAVAWAEQHDPEDARLAELRAETEALLREQVDRPNRKGWNADSRRANSVRGLRRVRAIRA